LLEPQHTGCEVDAADFQLRHIRRAQAQFGHAQNHRMISSAQRRLEIGRSKEPIDFFLAKRRRQRRQPPSSNGWDCGGQVSPNEPLLLEKSQERSRTPTNISASRWSASCFPRHVLFDQFRRPTPELRSSLCLEPVQHRTGVRQVTPDRIWCKPSRIAKMFLVASE
jgi:hypothetical protein